MIKNWDTFSHIKVELQKVLFPHVFKTKEQEHCGAIIKNTR